MRSDAGRKLLSDLVFVRTYSDKLPDGTKENPTATINRSRDMHAGKFPHLAAEIDYAFDYVHQRKVVPSMRSMQFAGYAVRRSNVRMYNCAYTPIESFRDISDAAYISMNGAGVGYSVQLRHVGQLPVIHGYNNDNPIVIPDTKEGWADSIFTVMCNPQQQFQYHLIRAKGTPLSTGGTASGPDSLRLLHERMRYILLPACGRQLRPIEVHDIMCHMGDLVFCGGVRRTALISLFDCDDEEMLTCKHGEWWNKNPQRARANNSAVILRSDPQVAYKIDSVLRRCFDSNCGEPGIFLTHDYDWGANPCVEIALRPRQFCNLTEINASACKSVGQLIDATEAATIIGTLQATYTDFDYIDPRWKENCEKDRLLGVSITGQAEAWKLLTPSVLEMMAEHARWVNRDWAERLGIDPAARIGCSKPSGSTSAWLCTTSGAHAGHARRILRRVRVDKDANYPIVNYLGDIFGIGAPNSRSVVERDEFSSDVVVVTVPISFSEGVILRGEETSLQLMERAKRIYDHWIVPSHSDGVNYHNVSLTVSYKPHEMRDIVEWIVNNRNSLTGISLYPYEGSSLSGQLPFEAITEEEYAQWVERYPNDIDLFALDYSNTRDARKGEVACGAGGCEIY